MIKCFIIGGTRNYNWNKFVMSFTLWVFAFLVGLPRLTPNRVSLAKYTAKYTATATATTNTTTGCTLLHVCIIHCVIMLTTTVNYYLEFSSF